MNASRSVENRLRRCPGAEHNALRAPFTRGAVAARTREEARSALLLGGGCRLDRLALPFLLPLFAPPAAAVDLSSSL